MPDNEDQHSDGSTKNYCMSENGSDTRCKMKGTSNKLHQSDVSTCTCLANSCPHIQNEITSL